MKRISTILFMMQKSKHPNDTNWDEDPFKAEIISGSISDMQQRCHAESICLTFHEVRKNAVTLE